MCDCIKQVGVALRERNAELVVSMEMKTGRARVIIQTQRRLSKEPYKRFSLAAHHCPFCGEKYPEPGPSIEGELAPKTIEHQP